jgi:transcriptional regulator with XRE-family HTH domain
VVSDTCDRIHFGQTASLARGFVGVSDSTITSFSGLLIEIDTEAAKTSDRNQGHLSKIERGKTAPSLEMLILLSERFHKSVDWILRGEGH